MKKFTGNFLFGEQSLGLVLRKIGLSMVAILMAVAVYAQPQGTYYVEADEVVDCYRQDNDYEVTISMRDFVEIDSFNLVLTYNDDLFSYESVSNVISELTTGSGLSVTEVVNSDENSLVLMWDSNNAPKTIDPNNDTTAVFVLHFSINGFQHVDESMEEYQTDLTWDEAASSVWNWDDNDQTRQILTWDYTDGQLDITQKWPNIEVDVTTANCDGGNAVATVLTPAAASGIEYSFNADDDWNAEDNTTLVAPSTGHTVMAREKSALRSGYCVSFVESFDVDAQPPFTYGVQEEVYVKCPGGDGDVEFTRSGGTPPYSYYIVPEADTAQVIFDLTSTGKTNTQAIDYLDGDGYNTGNRINQLPVGFYLAIAVDENNCIDVRETANWTEVEVMDTLDNWMVMETEHGDEVCFGSEDGLSTLYVSGATPFVDGYNVLVNGDPKPRTDSLELANLAPGNYEVMFIDSMSCKWDTTITIKAAKEIVFEVDHTDASCEQDNGKIWIEPGFTAVTPIDYWVVSTDPLFTTTVDTVWSVLDTAMNLAPNVYYVKLWDGSGCSGMYENPNGDNAIKVLSIDFELTYDPIGCYKGTTDVTISVTNPGNHGFKFTMDNGATWYAGDGEYTFEDVAAGVYDFGVLDTTVDCENYWTEEITEPDSLYVNVIDLLTLEPSCHGATDGNVQVRGYNGTTFESMGETYYYEYKFDDRDWEPGGLNNTFAADTGWHTIMIRDYYGCTAETDVYLELTPNVIDVEEDVMLECYGDVTTLTADTVSWIHEPEGLAQGEREPKFYYAETYVNPMEIVTNGNEFYSDSVDYQLGAGTYYFVAQDEWGCLSNVDTVVIYQPMAIDATAVVAKPAGCDGTTTGEIKVSAYYGIDRKGDGIVGRYQYMITQSQMILNQPDWYDQVNWSDFQNDDPANDSVMIIDVQAGTYYVAVRDYCGMGNPELIVGPDTVVVDGAGALDIDWDMVTIDSVTCNVRGEDPSDDGAITGLLDATTGGLETEGFIFNIAGSNLPADYVDENTSGNFSNLPAGIYTITVTTDSLGCTMSEDVTIYQSDEFYLETEILYASCNGVHDGVIRYMIEGGTAPFMETTNNVGIYENAMDIPDDRWYSPDETEYDRRVRAGIYETYIMDAKGCVYGPVIDTIRQPKELALNVVATAEPSCAGDGGAYDNGQIWVTPSGGWNSAIDGYEYTVTLGSDSYTVDLGDTVFFTGLTASNHVIKVIESNTSLPEKPIITYSDYFSNWGEGDYNLPWQNSASTCIEEIEVDLQGPDPIGYDSISWAPEQCYKTPTGQIYVGGITGGTPPYSVWVEGPEVYRPSTGGVGDTTTLDEGVTEYLWDDLVRGHYTVYIMDVNECQFSKESGEIERPDTLMITNTELVEDALCYGGEGVIQIDVTGGVEPYMYAVDSALVPDDGTHPIPHDDLVWQESDTFNVTAATWVAWVKDANGCIVGYATDSEGAPILQHRVTVLEPDMVEAGDFAQDSADCYDAADGAILIANIWGGNGGAWSAEVTGTDYDGNEVNEFYSGLADSDVELDGLKASTNKDVANIASWVEEDFYTVTIYDSEGCMFVYDEAYVLQPAPFEVELRDKNDAFVCPGDLAGVFEMVVVRGGTPFGYNGDKPIYEYSWEAYTEDSVLVDSLQADWGFTSTFQGYAGYRYHVMARDANGCMTETDTFIVAPEEITFMVEDRTCYDDSLASAFVDVVTGTEGREFRVLYNEIENDKVIASGMSEWFDADDDMLLDKILAYDSENPLDVHYEISVEDDMGCVSPVQVWTFDAVQNPVTFEIELTETTECDETYEIGAIAGGIGDHVIMLDDSVVTAMTHTLGRGTHVIKVLDSHMCVAEETVVVEGDYVTRNESIETYFERSTSFVDEEGGIDTMLAVGTHELMYDISDNCERTLIVEVVEVSPAENIMELQGEVSVSPWVGYIVELSGTITGVSANEGFYMQDANAAWSGVWVTYGETAGLVIGDGVIVKGEAAEVSSVTTINADEVTSIDAPLVVEPIVVATPTDAEDEMYESVLVTVENGTATAANEVTGEWTIYYDSFDNVIVNDLLFSFMPVVDYMYHVSGVVNGRLDMYKLEPRKLSDIVPANIKTVQGELDDSPWEESDVMLSGTITGVSANEGFFMQDASEAWSGIWVVWSDTEGLEVGDGVEVDGEVAEVSSVTTINASLVTEVDPMVTIVPVVLGNPADAEMEMYESVLVTIEGAQASAANEVTGEWTITYEAMNDAVVNDLLYGYTPEEGNYYDVTGVVNGRLDAFKVEPRMDEDIIDLTATPAIQTPVNIQFKVYPNPFNERIFIENSDKLTRVVVSNIAGQRVMDIEYPNNEIRTANLVSGVYIISMFTEDGIAKSERIVKR